MAPRVDSLYLFLIGVSVFFSLLISVLLVAFAIKYRRRPGRESVQVEGSLTLELLWTGIPAALTIVMFLWSSSLFMEEATPPNGALDIAVVGQRWMWKIQHSNGRREINELHLPVGQA